MLSLPELQRAFARGVLDDDVTGIASQVQSGAFPPARYLQIYRNNVFANLTQALTDVFPVVARLVGGGFMAYTSDAYIREHPPRSGDVHEFGDAFADFLRAFEPASGHPYLPDVARLEWAYHCAFHAADAPNEAVEHLRTIDASRYGELRFVLHPSARLIASVFPILQIWLGNQPEFNGESGIDLDAGGECVLVIRRGPRVMLESLTPGEFALLDALSRDTSFDVACAATLAKAPDFALAPALQRLVLSSAIIDIKSPTNGALNPPR